MRLPKSSKFWIAFLSTGCCFLLLCHPAWSQATGPTQYFGTLNAPSPTAPAAAAAPPLSQVDPTKDVFPRWSVAGVWRVSHPWWTGVITLRTDGSIVGSDPTKNGKWILTVDGRTPMLVLQWGLFGTESLTMVTPDHFRGQIRQGSYMDIQRGDAPQKPIAEAVTFDGAWRVTHPWWSGVITLRADGSIVGSDPTKNGKWILAADGGTPMLVLQWSLFGSESLTMVTPDHFRGQIRQGSFMDIQRGDSPQKPIAEAKTFNRKVHIPLLTPSSEVSGE